jgi:hypothetical protein
VGRRWLADGILNLLLFVPFGLAAGWNSRSTWIAVLCGLIFSAAIELAQTLVPGRDPALSDIVFNTLGTLIGALLARRPHAWLSPDPKRSAILTSIALVVVAMVMSATVILLSPRGSATVTPSGNDLLVQYPTRAGSIGLDEPEYWVASNKHAVIGPTVGQGWTLLGYPNTIGRRWGATLNGVWMLVLCLPVGFWARGRVRIAAPTLLIALLLLIPASAGTVPTGFAEWTGAIFGFLAGTFLNRAALSIQRRPDSFL